MAEYIDRDAALNFEMEVELEDSEDIHPFSAGMAMYGEYLRGLPVADVVAVSAYRQALWERDTALAQLAKIGKGLGESMDDVTKRKPGMWIPNALNREKTKTNWYCSECGNGVVHPDQFCHNCGVSMREQLTAVEDSERWTAHD